MTIPEEWQWAGELPKLLQIAVPPRDAATAPDLKRERLDLPKPPDPEQLAEAGDLAGLLEVLDDPHKRWWAAEPTGLLNRCLRKKATNDLDGLTDELLGRVVALAGLMFARAELHISRRLWEAEQARGEVSDGLPSELVDEGWVDRAARIGRFIAEIGATRARIKHVSEMSGRRTDKDQRSGKKTAGSNGHTAKNGTSVASRFPFP